MLLCTTNQIISLYKFHPNWLSHYLTYFRITILKSAKSMFNFKRQYAQQHVCFLYFHTQLWLPLYIVFITSVVLILLVQPNCFQPCLSYSAYSSVMMLPNLSHFSSYKMIVMTMIIIITAVYWTVTQRITDWLQVFINKCLQRIVNIHWLG